MHFVTKLRSHGKSIGRGVAIAGCAVLLSGCGASAAWLPPEQETARDSLIPAQWTTTIAPSIDLAGVSHATLRAWEDTRTGLPPLTIVARDSLAELNSVLFAPGTGWFQTNGVLVGTPLSVEYYRNSTVAARAAMIEIAHDRGGYFLVWRGQEPIARKADAAEIASFLAMFGITVEYR